MAEAYVEPLIDMGDVLVRRWIFLGEYKRVRMFGLARWAGSKYLDSNGACNGLTTMCQTLRSNI